VPRLPVAKVLLCAGLFLFTGCREQVLHNLSEIDVTRIQSRLQGQGIAAERERQPDGRWTISVASDDSSRAIQFIEAHRLLREERAPDQSKSSMLASREDQRFHYERSLARELESTLGTLEGVLEARVHLNLPPLDPIFGQPLAQTKGTASVLLIASPVFVAQVPEIASMIAGASGIPVEGVSVLISRSKELSAAAEPEAVLPAAEAQPATEKTAVSAAIVPASSGWKTERLIEVAIALLILGVGLVTLSRSRRLHKRIRGANAPDLSEVKGVRHAA
jgi:type III secretion protein J